MNDQSRETLDQYYAEAASWNRDRVQSMRSSYRIAWAIAGVAAAIALLEAIALVLLTPLKTVQPYTLMVDRTTGYVQALKPLDKATVTPDAALTQSFLVQYVIAREGFDMATLNVNYRKVALFSADAARNIYLQQMQVSNPQSPLTLYPRTTVVDAQVKSISPIGHNAALVRFDLMRGDGGAQPRLTGSWIAVVRYRFSSAAMSVEDRFINPLGFQVVSYRKDPEALPAATADAPPASDQKQLLAATAPTSTYYPGATQSVSQAGAVR